MRGEISAGNVWLFLILKRVAVPNAVCLTGQQRMKSHRTEPCPAAGGEENVLASHSTAPGKISSSEEEKSFPKEGGDSRSFLWKPLSSPGQAQIRGDSSFWFSWLISTACLTLLFPCISGITLPSLLRSYSRLHFWRVINMLTNAALCLSNVEIRKAANSDDTLQILAAVMQQVKGFEIQLYWIVITWVKHLGRWCIRSILPAQQVMYNLGKILDGYNPVPIFVTETFLASFGGNEVTPLIFREKHFTSGQVVSSISEAWVGPKNGHYLVTNEWTMRKITTACTLLPILG